MKDNLFLTEPNKKREFYSNNINENKSDSAKLWKSLKSVISNTKNTTNIGCLESEFGIVCKQMEIAQSFAKNFQTTVMKIINNLSSLPNVASLAAKASCTFSLSTVSEEFICKELKKIKTSKSTGLANIRTCTPP
jgi:hypothetical protein